MRSASWRLGRAYAFAQLGRLAKLFCIATSFLKKKTKNVAHNLQYIKCIICCEKLLGTALYESPIFDPPQDCIHKRETRSDKLGA